MTSPIISRDEARSAGLKRFFTAVACPRGHECERRVSNGLCVECQRLAKARDLKKNPERVRERKKRYLDRLDDTTKRERARLIYAKNRSKWKKKDPSKTSLNFKRWRADNLDAVRQNQAEYRKANPEKFRAYDRNRRAKKSQSNGKHTAAEIRQLYALQGGRCAACKCAVPFKKKHIDHIVPLCAGGRNDVANLQILCAPCNLSKGAKDPLVWAQEMGRLL